MLIMAFRNCHSTTHPPATTSYQPTSHQQETRSAGLTSRVLAAVESSLLSLMFSIAAKRVHRQVYGFGLGQLLKKTCILDLIK